MDIGQLFCRDTPVPLRCLIGRKIESKEVPAQDDGDMGVKYGVVVRRMAGDGSLPRMHGIPLV